MSLVQEPGYNGTLISLGGVKGTSGRGRQCNSNGVSVTTTRVQVLPSNSKRISCLMNNIGSDTIWLILGNAADDVVSGIIPNGSYQIDALHPWTGGIYAFVNTTPSTLSFAEMSVP